MAVLATAPLTRLETLLLPAPALLRFRDMATGRLMTGPLDVALRAAGGDGRPLGQPVALARAGQNSWCAHRLPGVRPLPMAAPDVDGDSGFFAQPRRPFVLTVADATGQVLPLAATLALPQAGPAIWAGWAGRNPAVLALLGAPDGQLPLFAAPGRQNPGAMAEIRCQLGAAAGGPPPAWALLTATIDGVVRGVGVSDANGAAVIFMAPPPLPPDQLIPPPGFAHMVTLRAYGGRLPGEVPDLGAVLDQLDHPAPLLGTAAPRALLPALPLVSGRVLVAATAGADGRLLMEPAP